MECVILFRNHAGMVGFIDDGSNEGNIAVFPNRDAAIALTQTHLLLQHVVWQIVELDEL